MYEFEFKSESEENASQSVSWGNVTDLRKAAIPKQPYAVDVNRLNLTDYLQKLIDELNAIAVRNNRNIRYKNLPLFDSELNRALFRDAARNAIADAFSDKIKLSKAHEVPGYARFSDKLEQISTLVHLLETTWQDISYEADTQTGKTILEIMAPLLHHAGNPDRKELFLVVDQIRNAPVNQTAKDVEGAIFLHSAICREGVEIDLGSAKHIHDTMFRNSSGDGAEGFRFRRISSDIGRLDCVLSEALSSGVTHVTMVVDEADENSGVSGNYNQMLLLKQSYVVRGLKIRMLFFTASPYAYKFIRAFKHVRMVISKTSGYSGTVQGILTPVNGLTEFGERAGLADLCLVSPNLFNKKESFIAEMTILSENGYFAEAREGTDPFSYHKSAMSAEKAWLKYRKWLVSKIRDILTVIHTNRCTDGSEFFGHGPYNGGRGIMLRFGTDSRSQISELMNLLGPDIASLGITPIKNFTKGMTSAERKQIKSRHGEVTIAGAIEELSPENHYIVGVVAAGRRADRLPTHCTVALDFTDRFSTMTSLEQGSMGRVSGFNKITATQSTYVLFSDYNAKVVALFRQLYKETGMKIPVIKPAIGVDRSKRLYIKTGYRVKIMFDEYTEPTIKDIQEDAQRLIGDYVKVIPSGESGKLVTRFKPSDDEKKSGIAADHFIFAATKKNIMTKHGASYETSTVSHYHPVFSTILNAERRKVLAEIITAQKGYFTTITFQTAVGPNPTDYRPAPENPDYIKINIADSMRGDFASRVRGNKRATGKSTDQYRVPEFIIRTVDHEGNDLPKPLVIGILLHYIGEESHLAAGNIDLIAKSITSLPSKRNAYHAFMNGEVIGDAVPDVTPHAKTIEPETLSI